MYTEEEIWKIIEENTLLKKKLEIAQKWMEREVKAQIKSVADKKLKGVSVDKVEAIEEKITKKITSYFWDLLLLNAPSWTIESITAAEISFYNMKDNKKIDGFAVISGYHKVLDSLLDALITKDFRKYAKKQKSLMLRVNDPMEKALSKTINSKYSIWVWRLYLLLNKIKEQKWLYDFGRCFEDYLDRKPELKEVLLDPDFSRKMTILMKSWVLWEKRHKWVVSYDETVEARKVLLGELKWQKAILYRLMKVLSWV